MFKSKNYHSDLGILKPFKNHVLRATEQVLDQPGHPDSPEARLGRSCPSSHHSAGRPSPEVPWCKTLGKAVLETGNPFSALNSWTKCRVFG